MLRKTVIILIIVAVLGLIGWQIYAKMAAGAASGSARSKTTAAVAVEVAPVRTEAIRDVALFTGSLYPKSYIVVAPKVAGRLDKLMVDIGDTVKSGELLAVIDDAEYAQQVEQSRAELAVAQANVQEARSSLEVEKREFDRIQALREKKIASESEFDAAHAKYDAQEARNQVALAQVAQREAALKGAEVRLAYTQIAASWDDPGATRVVAERFADEGAMLRANDQIVSIIDISSLTAVVNVIERDYSKIVPGQKAAITTDAFRGRVIDGTIVRVAPLLKETSRQARVEIEVANPDRLLKPGMFVIAHIEFDVHQNATVVPAEALSRQMDTVGVYVADLAGKKAHFVPVTIGITDEKRAEILDPPLSGFVVTLGQHLLSEGAPITVPESAPVATPGVAEQGGVAPAGEPGGSK